MTLSISTRLVLLVVLLVSMTAGTISYYLYNSGIDILTRHTLLELSHNLQRDGEHITSQIEELQRDVAFLRESPPIPGLIRASRNRGFDPVGNSSNAQWKSRLASQFRTLLSTNPAYMQVRLIDANGMEVIKATHDNNGIQLLPEKLLQDKKSERYFQEARKLKAGEIYFSAINLNREHGKISLPHTPVLRCAAPIYDQGRFFGLVIINLNFSFITQLLEHTHTQHGHTLYVTNSQGAYLSHPDTDKRFAIELGHYYRLQEDFPKIASLFAPGNTETNMNILPEDVKDNILVFVRIPFIKGKTDRFIGLGLTRDFSSILAEESRAMQQSSAIVVTLVLLSILLAAAFGNVLVRPLKQIADSLRGFNRGEMPDLPTKRTDEIGVLARALVDMADNVFSSHQELRTLNARLEDEVEERTAEVHRHFKTVNDLNRAQSTFISDQHPQQALQIMLDSLLEMSESEFGFVGEVLKEESGDPYIRIYVSTNAESGSATRAFYEQNAENSLELRNLDNLFGQVVIQGETIISNDPANHPYPAATPKGHPDINQFIGIPIYHADNLIGIIAMANRRSGYDESMLDGMSPYLNTCANMILSHQTRIEAEQSSQALVETRNELERVTSISPVIFYVVQASGGFAATFISPNAEHLLGYSRDECLATGFWVDKIHPDDRATVLANQQQAFSQGHLVHSYRFRKKSGDYIWVHDEVQLIRNKDGTPKELTGYWLDISDQKRAELQLLESEHRFRTMADSAPALIWLADTRNMGIWYNKHWLKYTGRSMKQELGLGWADGVHPDDLSISVEKCTTAFDKREGFEMEFRLRKADGSYGWIADTGIPRFNDNGDFEGYIGYCWDITDRKIAEQALLSSESKFRSIINSSPMGIFIYKLHKDDLIFSDFNPAANDILGINCEQFLGKTIEQAFPHLEKEIPEAYRRAAREGIPWHNDDTYYDDKENIVGAYDVYAFQTEPETMAVMFMDVTDRKNTENELRQSERELSTILDNLPLMMFLKNADDLRFARFNRAGEELLGLSRDELLGKNDYDLFPEQQANFFTAKDREVINAAETVDIKEEPIQTPRGERILHTRKTVITNNQGKPRYLLGLSEDITEQKQIQDELARFKATLDQTQDCVFMFEADTLTYFYVNQGATFLVGYSIDELLSLHPYDLNSQACDETEFRKFIQPLVNKEVPSLHFESEYRCKDGSLVPVEVILQYIVSDDQSARFIAMVRDITERRKIDLMKNEFISTVSHELRTPLTSIRGSLGLLLGGATGDIPDSMQHMIQIASSNTDRLLLLINDLLDIQKIESGQMKFDFNPIKVSELIQQAIEENESFAQQFNVQFTFKSESDTNYILGDHDRMMQVMGNLLSNAAKFSPAGAEVIIDIKLKDENVCICVTDKGDGIPEEFQPSLFERFTQHDSSDTRSKGGTGLGLSIVKAIIDIHHGQVDFKTAKGKGTSMMVHLPVCSGDDKKSHKTQSTRH